MMAKDGYSKFLWTLVVLGLKKADPIFRKTRLMYFDLIVLFSKK
jgi:hypothetical protein